jgi:hypothetical protein
MVEGVFLTSRRFRNWIGSGTRCGRSLTEPRGRPKVSNIAGDLRSAVSAGSETLAEQSETFAEQSETFAEQSETFAR